MEGPQFTIVERMRLMRLLFLMFLVVATCVGCGGYITKTGDSFEGQGGYVVRSPEKGLDTTANKWEGRFVRGVGTSFVANDTISVTLKSAYIQNFPEGTIKRAANIVAGSIGKPSPIRGQIAILANVVEFKNGVAPSEAESNGRVVYYSNDVYEGQFINRSFIPVYGPEVWSGQPVMIKFQLMELDQEDNAQMKAVLKSVAEIGVSATGIATSKLITGLNKIGDSLISSNADDRFGEYGAVFVPTESRSDEFLPVLRRGDVIFTRNGDRTTPINWELYCFNEREALVQKKNVEGDSDVCNDRLKYPPPFSYLVVSIQKNIGTNSMTPTLTLDQLQAAIQGTTSMAAIRESSNKISAEVIKNTTDNRLRAAIKKLGDVATPAGTRRLEAALLASALQCSHVASYNRALTTPEITVAVNFCGDNYALSALGQTQYEYFVNKLVGMNSCLSAEEVTEQFWVGDLTKAGVASARSTATSKIAQCKSADQG